MRRLLGAALLLVLTACGEDTPEPACEPAAGVACTWLGTGGEGFTPDGKHRRDTIIYWSMDLLFARDGTPWFIDWNNHLVRKVDEGGRVRSVVGWTDPVFPGDGTGDLSEASEAGADGKLVKLNHPTELLEDADGSLIMVAWHNHKLRRIDPASGRVRIISGDGAGYAGDGGPVAAASWRQPKSIVRAPTGDLYVADQGNVRVRRIDASGVVSTLVGVGSRGSGGDGGPPLSAQLNWEGGSNPEPSGGLALAGDQLFIADTLNHKIRVVDLTSNVITTYAGTGAQGYDGDGGAASAATFNFPRGLSIGPEGDLYVADTDNHVIRAIARDTGVVRTVAGTGEVGRDEGGLATATRLKRPFAVRFGPSGAMYVMDTLNSRILEVTP